MWAEACELVDQAERLHRQYFRLGARSGQARGWEPPVDIVSTADEVRITVALPGVGPDRIEVRADCGVLIVAAERSPPLAAGATVHRWEIPYGRFERRVALPAGRYELREQRYQNGCLELRLLKS